MIALAGHAVRAASHADAARIQALLELDPAGWALLGSAPLRADEAQHVLEPALPPGVPRERCAIFLVDNTAPSCDDVALIDLLAGYPAPETWVLGTIFVAPAARGTGLGTRLVAAIAEHVRAAGGRTLRLGVAVANARARRFYDRLGFAPVARQTLEAWTGGPHVVDVLELPLASPFRA